MSYSFVFSAPCVATNITPVHFRTEERCFFLVYFRCVQQCGECYCGYVQWLHKTTAAELKEKFPEFLWHESINEPKVYGAYLGFTGSLNGVQVHGQPRLKISPQVREYLNPAKKLKNKLKKCTSNFVNQILEEHSED